MYTTTAPRFMQLSLATALVLGALAPQRAAADCGTADGAKYVVTLDKVTCDNATDSMDADEVYIEVTVDGTKCNIGPLSLDTGDSTSPQYKAYFSMVSSWKAWEEDDTFYGGNDELGTKTLENTDSDGAHSAVWSPTDGQYTFNWTKTTQQVAPEPEAAETTETAGPGQRLAGARRSPDQNMKVLPPGAQKCADEGGQCTFDGKRRVYFGSEGVWVVKVVEGGVSCDSETFGAGPGSGSARSCFIPSNRSIQN